MAKRVPANHVRLKRVYEPVLDEDGVRILVERLWPRGVSKEKASLDHWMKELAPSTELRKWFGHEVSRWDEFQKRYAEELHAQDEQLEKLRSMARDEPITLIYSTRDQEHNGAIALREYILKG